jgi:hypothetical protein
MKRSKKVGDIESLRTFEAIESLRMFKNGPEKVKATAHECSRGGQGKRRQSNIPEENEGSGP